MKLKKILVSSAFVITSVFALSAAAGAEEPTNGNGLPIVTYVDSDNLDALATTTAATTTVPSINLNIQTLPTTVVQGTGAVLGNSTPEDSASTGDAGVAAAVVGMAVAAGIGAAAVAVKFRKK